MLGVTVVVAEVQWGEPARSHSAPPRLVLPGAREPVRPLQIQLAVSWVSSMLDAAAQVFLRLAA